MGSRGPSNGGSVAGATAIPAASRKMVQSLKEIVNCPEPEIYAMLKECNMDPNEAINRLLSQDPFHEVKRKREKKKENKDTGESRPRGISSTSNRGSRVGADRYTGRGGSNSYSSSESSVSRSKTAYKKDNVPTSYPISFSATGMSGTNLIQQPPAPSDPVQSENKISTRVPVDGMSSSLHLPSGIHSAWSGTPGQVSMADIVKMGRPHGKASSNPNQSQLNSNNDNHNVLTSSALQSDMYPSQHYDAWASELQSEPEVALNHHVPPNDEWPLVEQPPTVNVSSVIEPTVDSELYADSSNSAVDRSNLHIRSQPDEIRVAEVVENINSKHVGSASISHLNMRGENSGGASLFDNDLYENMNSYESQRHTLERHEDGSVAVSEAAENLQQLSLQNEQAVEPEEDNHSVKIPNHLQVQTEQFSHLSFGSFGAGITGTFASRQLKNEEASPAVDTSSVGHSDARNSEYYADEHLRNASDGTAVHRTGASAGTYDSTSVPESEALKCENPEDAQANQYSFPSSAPVYDFESTQHLNPAFDHSQSSSQKPDHVPFSNEYSNSLPSNLLASTVQPVRESDLSYSPFPITQSMPLKYNNSISSISGPTMSMPEVLRTAHFSSSQPTPQTLAGTSVATGPALPQHLAVHPYSQPSLPLGHFYPYLPPSYAYLPSAFQQAFAGTSSYHQSLAAVLPQYKNSVSISSLPQSAAVASGYGSFGSSNNIPGNFPPNPPTAPTGTTMGYEDIISSQYKDVNPLLSVQQNENSGMWLHGLGSRTIPPVPASTYYSYQGQNQQQASGFRQGQQPTQHLGALGYPNFYHSQGGGMSLEHQQNPRDVVGSNQGQQSKQSPQIWQNSY